MRRNVALTPRERELESKIRELEAELAMLREGGAIPPAGDTVRVPDAVKPIFDAAQKTVGKYFSQTTTDPTKATIKISGDRYVLLRASSLSVDFLATIKNLYSDLGDEEAFAVGRNFLFDISHVIGMEDAKNFHKKMGVTDPIAKLSAGPVHFAYSGWAFVDISEESSPEPSDNCFLKYDHPFSFEADAWIKAGKKSDKPVCIMNAGYSSGWCEESFGLPLTAVEITCKAAGDERCTFIMAPPHRIEEHLARYAPRNHESKPVVYQVPTFFERKRVEEEMKAARRKAEESDRMKSEFLANMSHEIRTPMNSIIGMTELILDTRLTDVQRDYLTTTRESAEALMSIINQILDFSKIEVGKLELDLKPFSLRECIGDTMKSLAVRAHAKNIELAWRVAPEIPDLLHGDAGRLRQVIVNLVSNAVKFTDEGEVVASVELTNQTDDMAVLHFQIRDTGIGIPQEKQEAIFQAFTQVDMSTTRRYSGTGLGLTISDQLVQLMGGRLWVESQAGEGSTFHFTVKFDTVKTTTDDSDLNKWDELHGLSVLVVGDDGANRLFLEETLSNFGLQVASVASASVALDCLLRQREAGNAIHLLITDVTNELSLIESVRSCADLADTRIIALTSKHNRVDLRKFERLAVNARLTKPVKQSDLAEAILRARRTETSSAPEQLQPKAAPGSDTDSGIKILLVEDGIANQRFAVAMLSRWGHTVEIANNGREAVNILSDEPDKFDLVLMDVLMPEMDGLQATAAIRELERDSGRHLPIVAITAQALKGDREKCLAAGMDDYLSKPIRRRELQQAIENVLG